VSGVRVRCPMGDWAQAADDRETAILLLVRHSMEAHSVGPARPDTQLAIARTDAKLAALGVKYVPPDGRYVPAAGECRALERTE